MSAIQWRPQGAERSNGSHYVLRHFFTLPYTHKHTHTSGGMVAKQVNKDSDWECVDQD